MLVRWKINDIAKYRTFSCHGSKQTLVNSIPKTWHYSLYLRLPGAGIWWENIASEAWNRGLQQKIPSNIIDRGEANVLEILLPFRLCVIALVCRKNVMCVIQDFHLNIALNTWKIHDSSILFIWHMMNV